LNKVEEFTSLPTVIVVFRVRYLAEFILGFAIYFDWFGWRQSTVIEAVLDGGFELQDVEDWVNSAETVRE